MVFGLCCRNLFEGKDNIGKGGAGLGHWKTFDLIGDFRINTEENDGGAHV